MVKAAWQNLVFLLTPLREGRLEALRDKVAERIFLLTPLREGRRVEKEKWTLNLSFLLTPLREGRRHSHAMLDGEIVISTHAPAGGATSSTSSSRCTAPHFYSRPCGRGDTLPSVAHTVGSTFLLTPLREGRHVERSLMAAPELFLLTPLREGRPEGVGDSSESVHFYSRPCGRGDQKE